MRRREVIAFLGAAAGASWPLAPSAQQAERVRRIGVLANRTEDAEALERIVALKQRLKELGWNEGHNIRLDIRVGGDAETWRIQAGALVASAPDVILVIANPGVAALQRETRTIPIVFVQVGDPVGSGFVTSLAHPAGNVTGFMHYEPAMAGKWLEVLKEIAPMVSRALVLLLPEVMANVQFARTAQAAGPALGMEVSSADVHAAGDIERAVTSFAREPNGGLVVLPNPVTGKDRALVAELATRFRLPAIAAFRYMAESGVLASYGIVVPDLYRRAAEYVDRILKGERPANLPVQTPTKFELVINLKTVKALGLTIPPSLLARADEVIE
jgi:ABC-type uncharacterized transport system substrate-binding protein